MKKLFTVLVGIWLSSNCWSQNSTSQFRSSTIDPSVSRHYITWEEKPNARYEVFVYTKDENGVEIPLETIKTEKNFTKINVPTKERLKRMKEWFSLDKKL